MGVQEEPTVNLKRTRKDSFSGDSTTWCEFDLIIKMVEKLELPMSNVLKIVKDGASA